MAGLRWNETNSKIREAKRMMGLNVYQVGVKLVDSLKWWNTLTLLETW